MDKININNLFKGAEIKPFNVHTLCDVRNKKEKEKVELNIDRLINIRDERENKVLEHYTKIYESCLKKINAANELLKTSLMFSVPESIFAVPNYDTVNCIEFIETKLKNEKFDTLVINDTTIYISWLNLGKNRGVKK